MFPILPAKCSQCSTFYSLTTCHPVIVKKKKRVSESPGNLSPLSPTQPNKPQWKKVQLTPSTNSQLPLIRLSLRVSHTHSWMLALSQGWYVLGLLLSVVVWSRSTSAHRWRRVTCCGRGTMNLEAEIAFKSHLNCSWQIHLVISPSGLVQKKHTSKKDTKRSRQWKVPRWGQITWLGSVHRIKSASGVSVCERSSPWESVYVDREREETLQAK